MHTLTFVDLTFFSLCNFFYLEYSSFPLIFFFFFLYFSKLTQESFIYSPLFYLGEKGLNIYLLKDTYKAVHNDQVLINQFIKQDLILP